MKKTLLDLKDANAKSALKSTKRTLLFRIYVYTATKRNAKYNACVCVCVW